MVDHTGQPDYLMLGHVTKDNFPTGAIIGGTSSYSAVTADKLGQKVAIVTSTGPDIPSMAALDGMQIRNIPYHQSTVFENIYHDGVRVQKWSAGSAEITLADIPQPWRDSPIVHFGPIAQELSPAICGDFPNSLVCVTVQGWLRGRDAENTVILEPNSLLTTWLPKIDVLVMSAADVYGQSELMNQLLRGAKIGVETLGPKGCLVYQQGRKIHVPVEPVEEVDPTGAGDIFAAAFFIKYREMGDAIKAAQFANACASLSVRRMGVEGIPTLDEVEARMAALYHLA